MPQVRKVPSAMGRYLHFQVTEETAAATNCTGKRNAVTTNTYPASRAHVPQAGRITLTSRVCQSTIGSPLRGATPKGHEARQNVI